MRPPPNKIFAELRKDAVAALCMMAVVLVGTMVVMTVIR
jgi:hypothetical protein